MTELIINKVIRAVCHMPRDFQERGDASMAMLLKESGYSRVSEDITEQLLEEYFEQHQDLIDAWLRNSEDTRGSPNWYMTRPTHPKGQWVVSFFPDGKTHQFSHSPRACAFYVQLGDTSPC
jgi:hypothetical protein